MSQQLGVLHLFPFSYLSDLGHYNFSKKHFSSTIFFTSWPILALHYVTSSFPEFLSWYAIIFCFEITFDSFPSCILCRCSNQIKNSTPSLSRILSTPFWHTPYFDIMIIPSASSVTITISLLKSPFSYVLLCYLKN